MEKLKFDPNKKYSWSHTDQFVLTGQEFGILLNAVRAALNTPEAARILMLNEANIAIENMLERSVEEGVAKEVKE